MAIFVGAYGLIVLIRAFCEATKSRNSKKIQCIVMGVVYFFIAALRGRCVGGDTDIYVNAFERISRLDVITAYEQADKDPVFYAFLNIMSKISESYTVLFIVIALFFSFAVTRFIYKYSKDPTISWIIALSLSLYQFTLTAMRQTIAISFVLIAFSCLFEKKWFKGVIAVLLGSLFHSSAIVVLAVFVVYKVKVNKIMLWCSVCVLGISFLLRNQIASLILNFFQSETLGYDITEEQSGMTMLLVILVLYIFAVLFVDTKVLESSHVVQKLFVFSFAAVFFETLVPAQPIFFRFAFYFLYGLIVLIPEVIMTGRSSQDKIILYLAIAGVLSVQYFVFTIGSSNIMPYYTF